MHTNPSHSWIEIIVWNPQTLPRNFFTSWPLLFSTLKDYALLPFSCATFCPSGSWFSNYAKLWKPQTKNHKIRSKNLNKANLTKNQSYKKINQYCQLIPRKMTPKFSHNINKKPKLQSLVVYHFSLNKKNNLFRAPNPKDKIFWFRPQTAKKPQQTNYARYLFAILP